MKIEMPLHLKKLPKVILSSRGENQAAHIQKISENLKNHFTECIVGFPTHMYNLTYSGTYVFSFYSKIKEVVQKFIISNLILKYFLSKRFRENSPPKVIIF